MSSKPPARTIIKSLGKRSGNVSASDLNRIVRDARGKFDVKAGAGATLKPQDTASGSGRIKFHVPAPAGARHRAA